MPEVQNDRQAKVLKGLTTEWQTTDRIARSIGLGRRQGQVVGLLQALVNRGLAEKNRVGPKMTEWRISFDGAIEKLRLISSQK